MSMILAPNGAIFALLAIAASAPIVPDDVAETWLREQFLIDDTPAGVTELTSRGAAFLRMVNSTPLPVKVERWDDPRGADAPPPAPPKSDAEKLIAGLAELLAARPAPAAAAPASRLAPAQPLATVTIPPDFRPVDPFWADLPLGQWPSSLRPDSDVITLWRDGRVNKPKAVQSVIWSRRDKPDDVIAYKLLDNDTIIAVG
jgi:hypothetical protein